MNTASVVGIILIVIGIVALTVQGITYTKREKVLELGPIEASKETKQTIPLSPILGGVALIGGIALVLAGSRRS